MLTLAVVAFIECLAALCFVRIVFTHEDLPTTTMIRFIVLCFVTLYIAFLGLIEGDWPGAISSLAGSLAGIGTYQCFRGNRSTLRYKQPQVFRPYGPEDDPGWLSYAQQRHPPYPPQ